MKNLVNMSQITRSYGSILSKVILEKVVKFSQVAYLEKSSDKIISIKKRFNIFILSLI
jgi:hypothetical protein